MNTFTKVAHYKYNHGPYGMYDLAILRPTGRWKIVHYPEGNQSQLFIEHRHTFFGFNIFASWVREGDITFAIPTKTFINKCSND